MYASVGLNKFATLDSGIDVGPGIFVKNNRALNKRRARKI